MEKAKKMLTKPQITPIALIIFIANVIYTIIILSEAEKWKSVVQISFQCGLLLSGFKFGDVRELLRQLKSIINDPKMSLTDKLNRVMEVVMTGCAVAGELWDSLNIEQGFIFNGKKAEIKQDTSDNPV